MIRFEIPLTPPSVNHYKKPAIVIIKGQRRRTMVLTDEALAYKAAVGVFARGETLAPASERDRKRVRYCLTVTVYMAKGERGDGDNFFKCIGDGLVEAGVIHSDAAVSEWHLYVDRDRDNPRTVIEVTLGSLEAAHHDPDTPGPAARAADRVRHSDRKAQPGPDERGRPGNTGSESAWRRAARAGIPGKP